MRDPHIHNLLRDLVNFVKEAEENAKENPTEDRIQVVIVEPDKKPYKKTIDNSLEAMQAIVGGYIENVRIASTQKGAMVSLIVNEEGKLIGLPVNRVIRGRGGQDILVGTFFVTASNGEGDQISLTDQECDQWIRRFSSMEVYV
jgi:uncharacterized protein DUF3846